MVFQVSGYQLIIDTFDAPARSAYLGFQVFDQSNELLIVLTTVVVALVVEVQDEEPSVCFFQPCWQVVCGHQERTVDGLSTLLGRPLASTVVLSSVMRDFTWLASLEPFPNLDFLYDHQLVLQDLLVEIVPQAA